ncbi:MAG: LysR family transcriptional regulator [Eubacterium sp.]|nr:LysR family transcriptional regulator [Eubacterium sp.]
MNLQQLEYFLMSAQLGSLTRAAEELYTTQPHVSQVIRSLEKELGVALFNRTGNGITLTPRGEEVRYYAEHSLKNASLIREICQENTEHFLKVAANPSSRLAILGEEYYLEHMKDDISLRYTECGTEEMLDLLQNQNYDLGFLFVPDNKRTAFEHMIRRRHISFTPLLQSDLVVYSGEKGPFFGRSLIEPEELNQCSCIQLEDDFFSVEELLLSHKAFHSGKCRLRKTVRTNSDHLMLRMLSQTALCNIGSYWQKEGYGKDTFYISVIDGFQGKVSFGYLASADRNLSREAEEFLSRCEEMIDY